MCRVKSLGTDSGLSMPTSMPGGQKANTYGCVLPGAAASARPPYVGVS